LNIDRLHRTVVRIGALAAFLPAAGCAFTEQSFPMRPGDLVRVSWPSSGEPRSTRQWLADTHQQLAHLLPASDHPALVTEDLSRPDGRPVDVLERFELKGKNLRSLSDNWEGLLHSSQAVGPGLTIDRVPPSWPGFEDIWIPVADDLQLSGRLGLSTDAGRTREADCIVLLPGLFGDNGFLRTRDLATALRTSGFHVLALEVRGQGQTEARYPTMYHTFGVLETVDLLLVSEWLEELPHVRRTGLIGYCWGANLTLLAAWYDGRPEQHISITDAIAEHLKPTSSQPHFSAGIVALSAALSFEGMIEELETPKGLWTDPVVANIQATIRARMKRKDHPEITHSVRRLIEFETAGTELDHPNGVHDGLRFLRLVPFRGEPAGDKLANARVPVLIMHGANDPVCPAQDVVDLMAGVDNPNVAALILPGGGHVGFAAYARAYSFSLILNFFDPVGGCAAAPPITIAAEDQALPETR
jgi:predicted alpha/beta-fold hydrolase